jgi:hypothetical protein
MCGAKRFWSKFEHLKKLATGTPVKTKRSIGEKKILRLCWDKQEHCQHPGSSSRYSPVPKSHMPTLGLDKISPSVAQWVLQALN